MVRSIIKCILEVYVLSIYSEIVEVCCNRKFCYYVDICICISFCNLCVSLYK